MVVTINFTLAGSGCDADNYVSILGISFSKLNLKEIVNLIDRKVSECNNTITLRKKKIIKLLKT
jgi:hypothetical protein